MINPKLWRQLGRPSPWLDDNIRIDFIGILCGFTDCIHLARGRDQYVLEKC